MTSLDRRSFLATLAGCAAHILWMSAGYGAARRLFAAQPWGRVGLVEPWGRLEELGPGVWAMISTPLAGERGSDAWRTVCNGGIIVGKSEVLVLEAFATPEGARWMADAAQRLVGWRPTLALVTHFHGDHTGGVASYAGEAPRFRCALPRPPVSCYKGRIRSPTRSSPRRQAARSTWAAGW